MQVGHEGLACYVSEAAFFHQASIIHYRTQGRGCIPLRAISNTATRSIIYGNDPIQPGAPRRLS